MASRRALLATGSLLALAGCLNDGGSGDTDRDPGPSLSSPAFTGGTPVPTRHTCDGADVSPPLRLAGPPDAESLALVVEDSDAPTDEPFVHWLLWNVPPDTDAIPEGIEPEPTVEPLDGAVQGTNDFGDLGYGGPCPPADDGPHTYAFSVLLLDTTLDLDPGADTGTFRATVDPHVTGETTLTGTYDR
jgi:Raf kinase inhibitor-like YbhB/YbcL family protein